MKKDEHLNKKLKIIDFWNYKEKFRNIKKTIIPRNPFLNNQSIANYIEVAFEEKPSYKDHPKRLPEIDSKPVIMLAGANEANLEYGG